VGDTTNPTYLATNYGHETYAPYPKPVDFARYPTYVMPLQFRAWAAQSSPFPCDVANTITLWLQTNVPLVKRCQPKLSVTGLQGFVKHTQEITVNAHTGGTTIGGDKAGAYTGNWVYAATGSSLTLDLVASAGTGNPMLAGDEPQILATFDSSVASGGIATAIDVTADHDAGTVDVLMLSFDVENQRDAREGARPAVKLELKTTVNTDAGFECAMASTQTESDGTDYGQSEMLLEEPPAPAGPYYADNYGTALARSEAYKTTLVGGGTFGSSTRAWSSPRWYENQPGYIRAADFFTHLPTDGAYVSQTTTYPCAKNTVTITLQSFVPVFATCRTRAAPTATTAADVSTIKLSGLNIFQTNDATWINTAVTLDPTTTAALDVVQVTETEILLQVKASQVLLADTPYVLSFTRFNHQKSRYGCDTNNPPRCWGSISVQACQGVASDLTQGYLTTTTSVPLDSTQQPAAPAAYAHCTNGIMKSPEGKDPIYDHIYATGVHEHKSHGAVTFEQQDLYVQSVWWTYGGATQKTKDGRTGISYPCDETTITVTLATDAPLLKTCGHDAAAQTRPKVTIDLYGVEKTISTDEFVTDNVRAGVTGSLVAPAETPTWTRGSGQLVVRVADSGMPSQTDATPTWAEWTDSATKFEIEFKVINSKTWGDRWVEISVDQVTSNSPLTPRSVVWTGNSDLYITAPFIIDGTGTAVLVDTTASPNPAGQPCAMATITVELTTNVPLLKACAPKITITGLSNSQPNIADDAPVAAAFGSADLNVDTTLTWTQNPGTVIAEINADTTYDASTASTTHVTKFQFNLRNPKTAYPGNGYAISLQLNGMAAGTNTVADLVAPTTKKMALRPAQGGTRCYE